MITTTFQCESGEHDLTYTCYMEASDFEECPDHPGKMLLLKSRVVILGHDYSYQEPPHDGG